MLEISLSVSTENEYTEVEFCSYGDYCGSGLIGKSNYEFMLEKYKKCKYIYSVYGDYGYHGIVYDSKKITKNTMLKLQEDIDRLENYPLLDEDAYSRMEWKVKEEYRVEVWDSIYNSEFSMVKKEIFIEAMEKLENTDSQFYNDCVIENDYAWINEKKYTEYIKNNLKIKVYQSMDYTVFKLLDNTYDINGITVKYVKEPYKIQDCTISDIQAKDITSEFIDILRQIEKGEL